ncbi:MAG: PDZ domain-containing protein [Clostridia bacterium]|nr:PDZ domain-containing protein [Clostridia bacterium]
MKILKKLIIIILLFILFIYVCYITYLPSSYIMMQGERLNIPTMAGISVKRAEGSMQTSSNIGKTVQQTGKIDYTVSLLDLITLKNLQVSILPKTTVIPIGKAIGMKLYTDGVLVVGMSEIEGQKPYENTGIQEGDRIIKMNQNTISNTQELMQEVKHSKGNEINITYVREEETMTTSITPVKTASNEYKIGLWVRDAAAGVGTLTFYEPSSGMFATLGHGILDVDTSRLIKIANGELVTTNILSITKGEKGKPRGN